MIFEVFMVMKMWIVGFWFMMPCRLLGGYQAFGGIYCLHLQGGGNIFLQNVCNHFYKTAWHHNYKDHNPTVEGTHQLQQELPPLHSVKGNKTKVVNS
jgi:hypothetical protein